MPLYINFYSWLCIHDSKNTPTLPALRKSDSGQAFCKLPTFFWMRLPGVKALRSLEAIKADAVALWIVFTTGTLLEDWLSLRRRQSGSACLLGLHNGQQEWEKLGGSSLESFYGLLRLPTLFYSFCSKVHWYLRLSSSIYVYFGPYLARNVITYRYDYLIT